MKSSRKCILLVLSLLGCTVPGCGCGADRQVIVHERRGSPIQVDTREGVRVRAPFVDVRVPARKATEAGRVDVPMIEPD